MITVTINRELAPSAGRAQHPQSQVRNGAGQQVGLLPATGPGLIQRRALLSTLEPADHGAQGVVAASSAPAAAAVLHLGRDAEAGPPLRRGRLWRGVGAGGGEDGLGAGGVLTQAGIGHRRLGGPEERGPGPGGGGES